MQAICFFDMIENDHDNEGERLRAIMDPALAGKGQSYVRIDHSVIHPAARACQSAVYAAGNHVSYGATLLAVEHKTFGKPVEQANNQVW